MLKNEKVRREGTRTFSFYNRNAVNQRFIKEGGNSFSVLRTEESALCLSEAFFADKKQCQCPRTDMGTRHGLVHNG